MSFDESLRAFRAEENASTARRLVMEALRVNHESSIMDAARVISGLATFDNPELAETSQSNYWSHVRDVAEEAVSDTDGSCESVEYWVLETTSHDWWVTYYHAALALMKHTRNDDYGFERGLLDPSSWECFSDSYIQCARWALYADVMDRLPDTEECDGCEGSFYYEMTDGYCRECHDELDDDDDDDDDDEGDTDE